MKRESLKTLVNRYIKNKETLDEYKKSVDKDNKAIKTKMKEQNISEYSVEGYTAKVVESTRDSLNEEKMIEIAKKYNINIVKTREYIDTDALEVLIYKGLIPSDVISQLTDCIVRKPISTLRISKIKGE